VFHIISFYNSKIFGLLNFYKFASNFSSLAKVIWLFKKSCALTLSLKFKLRTARRAFKKFGYNITDPVSGLTLKELNTYKVKHDFGTNEASPFKDLLNIKWSGSLTQTSAFDSCELCGTSNKIEMHHIRSVKDIRHRINSKSTSLPYNTWIGAFQRKQIPLCQYHHNLLHNGQLNHADLLHLAKYRANKK